MSLITSLRQAARKRAAYLQTVFELQGVPAYLAEDLAIFPGDAPRLAHQAVYG